MSQPQNDNEQPQQPGSDLASELRELGQQIENAVRTAVQSDRAKQIQQDVSAGMKEIGTQLQAALKSLQANPQVQEFVERSEQAVNQAQQSKAAQDFKETLARGVTQLNEQLAAFIARMNQPETPPTSDSTPPATGETTRLDPDK